MGREVERVVLLAEDGRAIGTAPKDEVHHADTPLHLAFSCYVLDAQGRLLVTRRAWSKRTWPGVWTNSCCGHPSPDEPADVAVRRRVRQELGIELTDLRAVLPDFRYRAVMEDGTVENEVCPVWVATCADPGALSPDPDEVVEHSWTDWARFRDDVLTGAREVSPWCRLQLEAMEAMEAMEALEAPDRPDGAGEPARAT
ncbi:isopentenyl-diphosphate delta-isomerase [Knoellia aerolata DSM 18566]|uniref:Isopentenyl-diphosphate Delta-isomerase n=1 Tax=Knoellia aerolata DSM 18566 TaxID=1385519 RepID=A0A0A0JKN6_9MICO|nr:isopentenyl-diphosphate Delta-isomerase [Knoellia aerolata]KGN37334.1 isopentenyl-diphosphate delta-isomerase [Knoellia aerolata DSM 18566]